MIGASNETFYTTNQRAETSIDIGIGTDLESTKKSTAIIDGKKLPKYYSSKLITRNQSGQKLSKDDSNMEQIALVKEGKDASNDAQVVAARPNTELKDIRDDLLGNTITVPVTIEGSPTIVK